VPLQNPFYSAEHHSCWRNKTLNLFEMQPSFQRPINSEKRKAARRAGITGCLFLASSFGQAEEEGS